MKFKEIVYVDGAFVYRDSCISQFLSDENKKTGYVIHKKQVKNLQYVASITFAFESDDSEGDEEYTLISKEKASNILRLEFLTIKRDQKKVLEDYYNELLISLMEA